MADKVVFSISTDLEFRGRELKGLKPNKDGVFTGIPISVIGMNSRNNICYDRESVINCLTDPKSRFVMNLKSGDLEGEWGHPLLDSDPKKCVQRLLYLDRTRVSHHFTRVYSKEVSDKGYLILYADVKPSGPYGKFLKDNFEDNTRNVSFSLRAATVIERQDAGVTYKRMLAMFTFDAVDGPGYVEASKRFKDQSTEGLSFHVLGDGLDIDVSKTEFLKATESLKVSGLESKIVDQCVLDAFGCDEIVVKEKIMRKTSRGAFVDAGGAPVSMFDHAFGL